MASPILRAFVAECEREYMLHGERHLEPVVIRGSEWPGQVSPCACGSDAFHVNADRTWCVRCGREVE